ncbi:hypothetical protein DICPUDRAFT_160263 [Dictyostelium purpureum]|uniref:Ribosome recycling factor domain-containing protein n=1 Tax=Dictyostelium purpureum TaxID=5786 RepID=F1A612_DICPU|nr:uncharacterized protein DICPUDRAFT_160263 [Dictyostelium purpureum]EGC28370.1 hypothetical protein DICPUDRAFT_160263 [Dictyostelium purpureum]|eukprot:XP_003295107.1 hypothetical protein DICPUDRAFT_160263 [Dictyostelium purpureum]
MIRGLNKTSNILRSSVSLNSVTGNRTIVRGIFNISANPSRIVSRRSSLSFLNENTSVIITRAKGGSKGGKGGKGGKEDDTPFTNWKDIDLSRYQEASMKTLDYISREYGNIRFGRAGPELLDRINVETPNGNLLLPHIAMVTVKDPLTLNITLYDTSFVKNVEKAIQTAGLGLMPQVSGTVIKVSLPKPTNDLRQKLIKQVNTISEDAKVSIRRHRKDAMDSLKNYKLRKDDEKLLEKNIQKMIDDYVGNITKLTDSKLKEINSV